MTGDPSLDEFLTTYAIVIIAAFFFPTLFAILRGHKRTIGVFILNIVVGWTGLGWILLLAYALLSEAKAQPR